MDINTDLDILSKIRDFSIAICLAPFKVGIEESLKGFFLFLGLDSRRKQMPNRLGRLNGLRQDLHFKHSHFL